MHLQLAARLSLRSPRLAVLMDLSQLGLHRALAACRTTVSAEHTTVSSQSTRCLQDNSLSRTYNCLFTERSLPTGQQSQQNIQLSLHRALAACRTTVSPEHTTVSSQSARCLQDNSLTRTYNCLFTERSLPAGQQSQQNIQLSLHRALAAYRTTVSPEHTTVSSQSARCLQDNSLTRTYNCLFTERSLPAGQQSQQNIQLSLHRALAACRTTVSAEHTTVSSQSARFLQDNSLSRTYNCLFTERSLSAGQQSQQNIQLSLHRALAACRTTVSAEHTTVSSQSARFLQDNSLSRTYNCLFTERSLPAGQQSQQNIQLSLHRALAAYRTTVSAEHTTISSQSARCLQDNSLTRTYNCPFTERSLPAGQEHTRHYQDQANDQLIYDHFSKLDDLTIFPRLAKDNYTLFGISLCSVSH